MTRIIEPGMGYHHQYMAVSVGKCTVRRSQLHYSSTEHATPVYSICLLRKIRNFVRTRDRILSLIWNPLEQERCSVIICKMIYCLYKPTFGIF